MASVSKRVPSFEARDATVIVGSFVSRGGSDTRAERGIRTSPRLTPMTL